MQIYYDGYNKIEMGLSQSSHFATFPTKGDQNQQLYPFYSL